MQWQIKRDGDVKFGGREVKVLLFEFGGQREKKEAAPGYISTNKMLTQLDQHIAF
jgi:hypothetical protein